jgi:hypothetical protein
MNKSKTPIAKFGKYLREISVVVIGVAITLSVSVWISNRNEKRNLTLYLNALKIELEQNAEMFENESERWQKSVRYGNYIFSLIDKSVNQDSISYYLKNEADGFGSMYILSATIYNNNAFEMLKTSGAMSRVKDKELLMSIWGAYTQMYYTQQFINMAMQIKREEVLKEVQLRMDGKHIAVPTKVYHTMGLPSEMERMCRQTSERLKEIISRLEETTILK